MNSKKIVLVVGFLAVFGFLFNFNTPAAAAATVEELQAQIQSLLAQITALQQQITETQGTTTVWCHDFNINLKIGDKSSEITQLKQALIKDGSIPYIALSLEEEFDEETASAVVGFQEKYKDEILTPYRLNHGTGFVGTSTRAKLNGLFSCALTPTPTNPSSYPSIADVGGIESTYAPGEKILLTVKGIEPDGTLATDTKGYNIQSYIFDSARTKTYDGVNGSYSPVSGFWNVTLTAPSDTSLTYDLQISLYCSRDNSSCMSKYEKDHGQVDKWYQFTLSSSSVQPSITVTSPNGGEALTLNTIYPVKIDVPSENQYEISFNLYNGSAKLGALAGTRPSETIFNWTVGQYKDINGNTFSAPAGQNYRIGLIIPNQTTPVDFSDNYFSIVSSTTSCHTAPLWSGNYCSVSCKCNAGEGDCDSNYECNTGYCAYDVGKKYGQYATIDVCEEKAGTKSITVLSPNGGEKWEIGKSYEIKWLNSNTSLPLSVWLEDINGHQNFISSLPAGATSYSWTIPSELGSFVFSGENIYKIGVYLTTDTTVPITGYYDLSNAPFSIATATVVPITVISPNGGEKWAFTNPYNIIWKANGVDKVNIYLEKWAGDDGQIYAGGPLTQTIDENISASTGFYSWPLGHLQGGTIASAGSYYKIRIVKTGDTSSSSQQIADSSDNYFSIVVPTTAARPDLIIQDVKYRNLPRTGTDIYAYFDITIKNIGETSALLPGSGEKEGDEFTVEVYKNNIGSGNKIAAVMRGISMILAANTTYTFTNVTTYQDANLSDVASIIVKADITDKVDESDETNNTLTKTITANISSITLLSPNGGEKWEVGKTYDVTWTMSGTSGTFPINIFATNEESSTFEPNSKCTNVSSGESVSSSGYGYKAIFCGTVSFFGGTYKYSLTVPSSWAQGSRYKINIAIPGAQDSSNNYFSIVPATATPITSFNYTETDSYSGSVKFSWTSTGVDNVSFQISCSQGLSITYAATGAIFLCGENDRRLSPDSFMYLKFDNTSGYPINAQASLTPFIGGIGDGTKGKTINFTISVSTSTSSITVLSPNGGERWAIGNTYEITWKSSGVDKVSIDITSGSSAYTLVSGIPASAGKYSWTIGANWPYLFTGDNYKIRVFAYPLPPSGGWVEGSNYDQSNNHFSIVSVTPGSLSVSLDASSPAGANLTPGQTNITFAKIKLTASVSGDVNNMNAIQIGSDSVNASNYLSNIKVYDGTTQLGTTAINLTYNGNYYYQWIYVSGVSIPAATSKVLTVVGDVKSAASNGSVRLGIAGLNFISPGAAVLGTPVYGYNMAVAVLVNPSITLISPNGGETWQVNYMYQIRWRSSNLPADAQNRISIGLVKKGAYEANPSQYLISLLGSVANDGSENVNIPSSVSPGEYKVEVAYCPSTGGECIVKDSSDNYFNIVSAPTCTDPDGRDYYTTGICKDDYGSYTDGCYGNSVKEYYCDTSKLCDLEWVSCPYGCDSGICKTGIKVLSPNGGEQWTFGNTYDITWESGGIDKVNIELITPTGGLGLASNILASAGKFNWKVDITGDTSDSYKIRISNSAETSVSDSSDNYFSIVSGGLGLKNLENLLADISKAVSKLLEEIK